jgi:hypothetical protein
MPVARLLRLVLTFVVLVGGALSALGCGVIDETPARVERAQLILDATALRPMLTRAKSPPARLVAAKRSDPKATSSRAEAFRVGDSSTPRFSGTLRGISKARGTLLALLSHALADSHEAQHDEFEPGDAPDLVGDDCPQAVAVAPSPCGVLARRPSKPLVAPNLWEIQPSLGHPRGDDEPPRV